MTELVEYRPRPLLICVPIRSDGQVDPRWGRAARVAIAETNDDALTAWHEFEVGWDESHYLGTEGSHHARVARFLKDHGVEMVVAQHVGPPMMTMLDRMGLSVRLGQAGMPTRQCSGPSNHPAGHSLEDRDH